MDLVKELGLTADRRDQLVAWLNDEQLLRNDYPVVADYLGAAARLPQGPNSQGPNSQEAMAFDVRLLHYMTGDRSLSANPYWDIVAPSVTEREGRRFVTGSQPEGSTQLAFAQTTLQPAYAYAIPSPETIDWVSKFCQGRQVVEIGAGRGYWAAQLSRAGIPVDAYDLEPPSAVENVSFPQAKGQQDVWYTVRSLDGLRFEGLSDSVLFLCWPPGWGNTMASDTLAAFERAGGDRLIYVGEPKGGKTGDDAFFDALSARWQLESTDSRFVSWWNLADVAEGWVRA